MLEHNTLNKNIDCRYLRVATTVPRVHVGNVSGNCEEIIKAFKRLEHKADIIITPELSLTGYTCADLFNNRTLIYDALKGLEEVAEATIRNETRVEKASAALVVGLPFERNGELFNCAAVIFNGTIKAIIPKTYLPNYGEFYEQRWFSAREVDTEAIHIGELRRDVMFGNNIILNFAELEGYERDYSKGIKVGIEICEDAWAPISPSRKLALNGAEVILNISASNEVIGKAQYRKSLISGLSASCICGYAYVSAGKYESTSDLVFSGHSLIYENGKLLGESEPFSDNDLIRDISISKIRHDRIANKTFTNSRTQAEKKKKYKTVEIGRKPLEKTEIAQKIKITPFIPSFNRRERCMEIFNMQVAGLQRRIEHTGSETAVIGVSGGLDSTLALLVAVKAMKNLDKEDKHRSTSNILAVTMPGFGTTDRTKTNAIRLVRLLGCELKEVDITTSVKQHLEDIGHSMKVHDITYENAQARERTQILMDLANANRGFVIGTGDLSELALGWCTYNGDHMSMYAVNTSVPKTLVRAIVEIAGNDVANSYDKSTQEVIKNTIRDILDTPISPELLPPNEDGTIAQKTEDSVGSYILHDFFLYYTLRYGYEPEEIFWLCHEAVKQSQEYKFNDEEILRCMEIFYTKFFKNQFKRNCMPDGVKVGTVSVSPRGDLRLPSEIESDQFINRVRYMQQHVHDRIYTY